MRRRTFLRGAATAGLVGAGVGWSGSTARAAALFDVVTCEQYLNQVLIHPSTSNPWATATRRWVFGPGTASGWNLLSDARTRDVAPHGWTVLTTSSGGRVAIVDLTSATSATTADVVWSYDVKGRTADANPHAIEWVPTPGVVAVAESSGTSGTVHGNLLLFASSTGSPANLQWVQTIPFEGAHGVLWHPPTARLWVLGMQKLQPYAVSGTGLAARLVASGAAIVTPGLGHDLQPDYSDAAHQRLLVTGSSVVSVNTSTAAVTPLTFTSGGTGLATNNVKSFVRHTSGEGLWVRATGLTYHGDTRNWVSPQVDFFTAGNAVSYSRALSYGAEFYKARFSTLAYV